MYTEVVDVLTEKGEFKTEQALAVAEAIDMTIEKAQLVTVPILDARLAVVNARIDALEIKLDAKLQRWSIRMMIVMVASQTALGPIGASALQALRGVLSTLGH
jgi:hypothetical protein